MFTVVAVEPLTDDIITEEDAQKMRLPFNEGWDHWAVMQDNHLVFASPNYDMVKRTHSALSNLIVLEAAA